MDKNYARRKWLKFIDSNNHMRLSKLLLEIKAISKHTYIDFLDIAHDAQHKDELRRFKKLQDEWKQDKNIFGKPPKSIKPNKARF